MDKLLDNRGIKMNKSFPWIIPVTDKLIPLLGNIHQYWTSADTGNCYWHIPTLDTA